jgi:AraC-like DNA-binding protein
VAQEIRRVRIEKAMRELVGSDRPTEEIALRAGFTSSPRMCEVFKRELGLSPGEYREQRKLQKNNGD